MDEPVYPDAERMEWPPITKLRKIISVPVEDIPLVINENDEQELNPRVSSHAPQNKEIAASRDVEDERLKNTISNIDSGTQLFEMETSSEESTNKNYTEGLPHLITATQTDVEIQEEIQLFGDDDALLVNPEIDDWRKSEEKNRNIQSDNLTSIDSFSIISEINDRQLATDDEKLNSNQLLMNESRARANQEQSDAESNDIDPEQLQNEFIGNIDDSLVPIGDDALHRRDEDDPEDLESGEAMSMESYFIVQEMENNKQATDKQSAYSSDDDKIILPDSDTLRSGTDCKVDDDEVEPFLITAHKHDTYADDGMYRKDDAAQTDNTKPQQRIDTRPELASVADDRDILHDVSSKRQQTSIELEHNTLELPEVVDTYMTTNVTTGVNIDPGADGQCVLYDTEKLEGAQQHLNQIEGQILLSGDLEKLDLHPDIDRENVRTLSAIEKKDVERLLDLDMYPELSERQDSELPHTIKEDTFAYTDPQQVDVDLDSEKNNELIHSILDEKEAAKYATEDEVESIVNPFTENESAVNPFTENESVVNPFTENKSTVNPFTDNESTVNPFTENESTVNPFTENESTVNTFTENESSMNPFTENESTMNPFNGNELSDIHLKAEVKSNLYSDVRSGKDADDQSPERNKDIDQEHREELCPDKPEAIHSQPIDENRERRDFQDQDQAGPDSDVNTDLKDLTQELAGFQQEKDEPGLYRDQDEIQGEKQSDKNEKETYPGGLNEGQGDVQPEKDRLSSTYDEPVGTYPDTNNERESIPTSERIEIDPNYQQGVHEGEEKGMYSEGNKKLSGKFKEGDEGQLRKLADSKNEQEEIFTNQDKEKLRNFTMGTRLDKDVSDETSRVGEPNDMDEFSDYTKASESLELPNELTDTFSPYTDPSLEPVDDNLAGQIDKDFSQNAHRETESAMQPVAQENKMQDDAYKLGGFPTPAVIAPYDAEQVKSFDNQYDRKPDDDRGSGNQFQSAEDSQMWSDNRNGRKPSEDIGKLADKHVESHVVPLVELPNVESGRQRNSAPQAGVVNPSFTDDWDLGPWTAAEEDKRGENPAMTNNEWDRKPSFRSDKELGSPLFQLDPLADRSQHNIELPIVDQQPGGANVSVSDRDLRGPPKPPHSLPQEPVTPQKPQAVVIAQPVGITSADPVEDRTGSRQSLTDRDALIPRSENRDWSTGLFACRPNCGDVCYATSCLQCAVHGLATRMEQPDARAATVAPFCNECYLGDLRTRLRAKYGIKGAEDADCCLSCWCAPCVVGQMIREMNERNRP